MTSNINNWRASLPELEGLPLLPVGAGQDGKAPINPNTSRPLARWQKASFSPMQIQAMNDCVRGVGLRPGPDAGGLLVLDLDGASAIAAVELRGVDPETTPTWQIRRTTAADRLKLIYRVPKKYWPLLAKGKAQLPTGEREQIDLFWRSGQAIVLGEHRPSGGFYVWQGGPEQVEALEPSHPLWPLVLEQLGQAQGHQQPATPRGPASTGKAASGIPVEQLLSREQLSLWLAGAPEGGRNDALFRITVGLQTAADGAAQVGLATIGNPEELAHDFARRCSPTIPEGEAKSIIRSALSTPRTPDPGLQKRIEYRQRLQQVAPTPSQLGKGHQRQSGSRDCTRSELLAACLQAAKRGDEDTQAEAQAELMNRFRMTCAQVQAALFKLLSSEYAQKGTGQGRGFIDIRGTSTLEELLPGFIPAKEQTLLHAPMGTGKTLAALSLARAVVTGSGFLDQGAPGRPGKVLYLATDSGCASLHEQMQELGLLDLPEFQSGPEQRFFVRGHDTDQNTSAWEATIPEILWLIEVMGEHQFDLVIIDSAKACLSLTELDYTDNKGVGSLLTLFQRAVCPHGAVLWLHHDGRESGHNAGAKAWGEIPVAVHRIERVEPARGEKGGGVDALPQGARRWVCKKSRIHGLEREFAFVLTRDGELRVAADVEIVGSCHEAVVGVFAAALARGVESLPRPEVVEEVMRLHGLSRKTVDNTLQRLARGRGPVLVRPSRGRYALSPAHRQRMEISYRGACRNGGELDQNAVSDRDLPITRRLPDGYNRVIPASGTPIPSRVPSEYPSGNRRVQGRSQSLTGESPNSPPYTHAPPKQNPAVRTKSAASDPSLAGPDTEEPAALRAAQPSPLVRDQSEGDGCRTAPGHPGGTPAGSGAVSTTNSDAAACTPGGDPAAALHQAAGAPSEPPAGSSDDTQPPEPAPSWPPSTVQKLLALISSRPHASGPDDRGEACWLVPDRDDPDCWPPLDPDEPPFRPERVQVDGGFTWDGERCTQAAAVGTLRTCGGTECGTVQRGGEPVARGRVRLILCGLPCENPGPEVIVDGCGKPGGQVPQWRCDDFGR